jgi:outer membrane protein, heavy metal efflux system
MNTYPSFQRWFFACTFLSSLAFGQSNPPGKDPKLAVPPVPNPTTPDKLRVLEDKTKLHANSTKILSIEHLLTHVQNNVPLIMAAEKEKDVAEGSLLAARGGFDGRWLTKGALTTGVYPNQTLDTVLYQPTTLWGTSLFAGWRWGQGDFALYDGKMKTTPWGEFRAGLMVPILRDGKIDKKRAQINKAKLGIKLAGLSVTQQRIEVAQEASYAYWKWVAAGHAHQIAISLVELAEARDVGIRDRVARGLLPQLEAIDNQRTILSRKSLATKALRDFQKATFKLSLFLRDEKGEPLLPSSDQVPPTMTNPVEPIRSTTDYWVAIAQKNRPEFRFLALKQKQKMIERDWANNQTLPRLDINLMASQDSWFQQPQREPTEFKAMFLLDIPLATRTARGNYQVANAQLAQLKWKQRFTLDKIRVQIQDALSAWQNSKQRWELAKQEVGVARLVEQAEKDKFQLGSTSILLVNLREQASANALIKQVYAFAEVQSALVDLQAVSGTIPTGKASR